MEYKTVYITTSDDDLSQELQDANLPGVEVLTRLTAAFSYDQVIQYIVHLSSEVAVGVFAAWLYDKIKKKDPSKTTINSKEIIHNITEITLMINQNQNVDNREDRICSCPYCSYDLKTIPQRRRKCPSCHRPIYVKSRPENQTKRIMTETQAMAAEREWDIYNIRQRYLSVLSPFGVTERDIEREIGLSSIGDREAVISLLTRIEREADDLQKQKIALGLLAVYAEEDGRPFHEYLVKANLCELHRYKQMRVRKVEILTSGPGNACKECENNTKKVFEIDDAIRLMPLPHPSCTRTIAGKRPGFCRCSYVPEFD
jgi:hypothetical protein